MTYEEVAYKGRKYLESLGFIAIDLTPDGHEVWRQKDDEPKMDIIISFVPHMDNL